MDLSLRENAVATYKKLMGDKADETIVTMLNAETTGMVTLISLTKDYQARLEEKFPMTCAKCGFYLPEPFLSDLQLLHSD
jgi:hypothetical protein